MLITRCAWHRRYYGYVSYTGLRLNRSWRVTFSDGICSACAVVFRASGRVPQGASVRREVLRAAVALTAVTVWLAVMLLWR